jgi:hypothetical protein
MRGGSGVELAVDHLYKVTAGDFSGRKYLVQQIDAEHVLALEGWFQYTVNKDRGSPEDTWTWSAEPRSYPREHFAWVRDLGRTPEVGEPRFRFTWALEELTTWRT